MMKRVLAGALTLATVIAFPVSAHHGDIHAYCDGDKPVVTHRPAGMEDVMVICRKGVPDFMLPAPAVPFYRPAEQAMSIPDDFAGWVLVWINDRPMRPPFNPARGLQEPGAFLTARAGRVMMPVRFFTEALGGQVDWDGATNRVYLTWRGKQIILTIGAATAQVDGQTRTLDQAPVLFMDRTFVPTRFLLEAFGARVDWDQNGLSARIMLEGASCVSPVYCGEAR